MVTGLHFAITGPQARRRIVDELRGRQIAGSVGITAGHHPGDDAQAAHLRIVLGARTFLDHQVKDALRFESEVLADEETRQGQPRLGGGGRAEAAFICGGGLEGVVAGKEAFGRRRRPVGVHQAGIERVLVGQGRIVRRGIGVERRKRQAVGA